MFTGDYPHDISYFKHQMFIQGLPHEPCPIVDEVYDVPFCLDMEVSWNRGPRKSSIFI